MPESCARCGQRPVADPDAGRLGLEALRAVMCDACAERGPLTPEEGARLRERRADDRADWPVHQPEAHDAPIPGRHWYAGCEPGGDWDYELERYLGTGPRVDPETGVCEGCGASACRVCGREACPDHEAVTV